MAGVSGDNLNQCIKRGPFTGKIPGVLKFLGVISEFILFLDVIVRVFLNYDKKYHFCHPRL